MVRREAAIYDALRKYDCILNCVSLEVAVLEGAGLEPKAWALRLERAPGGSLRHSPKASPMCSRVTSSGATSRPATPSFFDGWRLKLCDFGTSSLFEDYDHDWWGAESRYTPPGPQANAQVRKDVRVGTIHREIFALGSAIYEIVEWKVPYGSEKDVPLDEVHRRLIAGQWPELDENNPAKEIVNRCWAYEYDSARGVVHDLQSLLN